MIHSGASIPSFFQDDTYSISGSIRKKQQGVHESLEYKWELSLP
jgi:hypothetical protein